MGFWGTLGKLGSFAAGFIPGGSTVANVIKGGLAVGGAVGGGILAGKAVAKDLSQADDNTKLLKEQSAKMFGQANPAFGQALDTYGKLAGGDKGTLASFTGTEANDLNRATSNQIQRAKSTMNRGGAQSKVLSEAPGELERSALALRSNARSGALDKLGSLGLAGSQASNQALGQASGLELQRRGQNIGVAKDIGEGVGTILDKTGAWGKLGQTMGNIFGGGKAPGVPEFGDMAGPGAMKLPDPGDLGAMNTSFGTAGLGNPINLDLFGQKKNEKDVGSFGQMFSSGGGL